MKQKGKWQINESKEIYKNPWITVIEENGTRPDGQSGSHVLILYKPGVAVLPMDDEGNVYLNREYRFAIESTSIETVAGGIEEGDSPLAAAKKELGEELGIEASEWIDLGTFHHLTETVFSPSQLFIAKGLTFKKSHIEGTEDIEMIKMPLNDAVEKVLSGEINFAIAGLLILIAAKKML